MTKKQAIMECKALWMWLEKHPALGKEDKTLHKKNWPGWKKLKPSNYLNDCPCCEYAFQNNKHCDECPLSGWAWKYRCWWPEESYNEWCKTRTIQGQQYQAHKIVLACRRALYAMRD